MSSDKILDRPYTVYKKMRGLVIMSLGVGVGAGLVYIFLLLPDIIEISLVAIIAVALVALWMADEAWEEEKEMRLEIEMRRFLNK